MTKEEALKLADIIKQVDGGCWSCVSEACMACNAAFPQFVWTPCKIGELGSVSVMLERSKSAPPPPPPPPEDLILKEGEYPLKINFSPDTVTSVYGSDNEIINLFNCPMPFLARWLLKMKN